MSDQIEQKLLQVITKHCSPDVRPSITLDTPLEATGLDSLSMSEIIFELEDAFGCPMPDPESAFSTEFRTIRELRDAIVKALPAA